MRRLFGHQLILFAIGDGGKQIHLPQHKYRGFIGAQSE
jgi:hypothetical protein